MKRLLLILLILMVIVSGCESVKMKGIIIGATIADIDMKTNTPFGQQTTRMKGVMPFVGAIFEFGGKNEAAIAKAQSKTSVAPER